MNTKLTRQVLFEKSSPFWNYSDISEVPDKFWIQAFIKFKKENDDLNTDFDMLEYIALNFFSPIVGIKDCKVSEISYYHLYGTITFETRSFTIPTFNLMKFGIFVSDYINLKNMIILLWDK